MQRYELHKSQISDDFVYWFRNGEDIFQAVFRKKSLKMSVLYWRVPYIYCSQKNKFAYNSSSHIEYYAAFQAMIKSWTISCFVRLLIVHLILLILTKLISAGQLIKQKDRDNRSLQKVCLSHLRNSNQSSENSPRTKKILYTHFLLSTESFVK